MRAIKHNILYINQLYAKNEREVKATREEFSKLENENIIFKNMNSLLKLQVERLQKDSDNLTVERRKLVHA